MTVFLDELEATAAADLLDMLGDLGVWPTVVSRMQEMGYEDDIDELHGRLVEKLRNG